MKIWGPETIREHRDRMGLTREAFGDSLGVTGNYIYLLEKGVKTPSKTLCLLLDCVDRKRHETKKKGGDKHGKRDL